MQFEKSVLFGISSLKELSCLLGVNVEKFTSSKNIFKMYHIKLIEDAKKRIVENPPKRLKGVQRKVLSLLNNLDFPSYICSVTGKSTFDAVKIHAETFQHVITTDISKFFMSTGREKIYSFWLNTMKMAKSVALVMTNLTSIDYREIKDKEVTAFMANNKLCTCHLGTGLPTSNVLSFLCNYQMYEDLSAYCNQNDLRMSAYVDDLIFSSNKTLGQRQLEEIRRIISKNGYKINLRKTKILNNKKPKILLGLVLKDGNITVPKSVWKQIREDGKKLLVESDDDMLRLKYNGLKNYAKDITRKNNMLSCGRKE